MADKEGEKKKDAEPKKDEKSLWLAIATLVGIPGTSATIAQLVSKNPIIAFSVAAVTFVVTWLAKPWLTPLDNCTDDFDFPANLTGARKVILGLS